MFEFWREATAALVPGLLCQSGRRRLENVSILGSLIPRREDLGYSLSYKTVKALNPGVISKVG